TELSTKISGSSCRYGPEVTARPWNLGTHPARPDDPPRRPLGCRGPRPAWSPGPRPIQGARDLVVLPNGLPWYQGPKAAGRSRSVVPLDPIITRRLGTEMPSLYCSPM